MTDVVGLLYVAGVAALLSAAGIGLDKMLLQSQRTSLRDKLTDWWCFIEDFKFPDVVSEMATVFLRIERQLLGRHLSIRWFLTTFVLSILLTTVTVNFGDYLWFSERSESPLEETFAYFWTRKPVGLYLNNYVLDALTIILTVFILRQVVTTSSVILRVIWLLIDLILGGLLAFICWEIAHTLEFPKTALFVAGTIGLDRRVGIFLAYFAVVGLPNPSPLLFGLVPKLPPLGGELGTFLYSNTTFIPTFAYVSCVLVMIAAIAVFRTSTFIARQVLALSIETEKSVFFYTGTLLGLLGICAKLLAELNRILR